MTTLKPQHLHAYILPGHIDDAREGLSQAREAEELGLGGILLSERWETKEFGSVMGALTQVTSRVNLVAGLTHFGTRHPLVLAGIGATMQTLSAGRFTLGFGRGVPAQFRKLGIPQFGNAGMADFVGILRQLWAGETVSYSGPAGEYPEMQLGKPCSNPPPVILGAVGPNTLAMAGTHFDGLLLHPFLSYEGVARSVEIVRNAARDAGRGADAVRIYATVVTAPDYLLEADQRNVLHARAVSYFMHREVGLPIVKTNGWDEAAMDRIVATGLASLDYGAGDAAEKRKLMAQAAALIPPEWLSQGAATGSTDDCLNRLQGYLGAGADGIVLHGIALNQLAPLISALA